MTNWLLTIFGILIAATVGFGFNYYLQWRLFKVQSKEKSIDMLMDALDSLHDLYVDSWGYNESPSSNKILLNRHRFSVLATSVSKHFKFSEEIDECLKDLADKSPDDDFNSKSSTDEDLQETEKRQNELWKVLYRIYEVLMKNRYR